MSTRAGKAYHPVNGSIEEVWEGFSWPCLFLGFIWYIYKGMWGWGLIALIVAMSTFGISWLVFPFYSNAQHIQSLKKRGYLSEQQWKDKQAVSTGQRQPASSVADELAKLAALKERGVLSDEEFANQKHKLLA